uniref:G-protein coupled receptors family 1 profile domain-containing protein n=1 Tax=Timema genevievae TaxID=629358 RepID=A0A7R9JRP2_TIMGE|nr:unnamed protein product [Timema genevievae]
MAGLGGICISYEDIPKCQGCVKSGRQGPMWPLGTGAHIGPALEILPIPDPLPTFPTFREVPVEAKTRRSYNPEEIHSSFLVSGINPVLKISCRCGSHKEYGDLDSMLGRKLIRIAGTSVGRLDILGPRRSLRSVFASLGNTSERRRVSMMNSSKEEEGWLREGVIWSDCSYNLTSSQDMEDPSSSQQFMDGSRFWIQRVMVPLVVGVGVLGNVVTMVVLTRRRMRSSTNVYLTALAASDLLYLILVFTLSLDHYPNIHDATYYIYWQYLRFGYWLADAASKCLLHVKVPGFVCFLSTVTTSFEWTICQRYNGTSVIHYYMDSTKLAVNEMYRTAFYWFTSVTFIFLPLTALGVFNSILIYIVHKSRRQRYQMTQIDQADNSQSQENKITVTLIAVVVLFMFCQIPTALILLYTSFQEPLRGSAEDNVLRGLGNIFNFLNAVNAACNFILYCAFSDKYRRTFLVTFFGRWYRAPSRYYSQKSRSTQSSKKTSMDRLSPSSTVRLSARAPSAKMRTGGERNSRGTEPPVEKENSVKRTSNSIYTPLFESVKFQFLIHGLPAPQRLDQINGSIVTKPRKFDQDCT